MRRVNPNYISDITIEPEEFDSKTMNIHELDKSGRIYLPHWKLERLCFDPGQKVNVGLNHQGLVLAIDPWIIEQQIEELGNLDPEFFSELEKSKLCRMYEDFGKFTEQREVSEEQLLRIPATIRKKLNLHPRDEVKSFEAWRRLVVDPTVVTQK